MSDSGANNQPVSHESEARPTKASSGARLAALREERGWTVEQVASQLNLAPRQVLAIERDDYPALPGMAVTRGFIRAYAKLLKVDAAPYLEDLGGDTVLVHDSLTPQKSLSTPFADSRLPSMSERPGISSKWVVGGLVLVLLVVGVWATMHGDVPSAVPSSAAPMVNEGVNAPAGVEESKSPAEMKGEQGSVPAAENAAPATSSNAPDAGQQEGPQLSVVPPTVAPAPSVMSDSPVASEKDALQLTVREESWVEIRRSGDNSVLLSRIMKPGETETIKITEPVSIVVGNATGVDAILRGAPLELKSSARSNVARLTVK